MLERDLPQADVHICWQLLLHKYIGLKGACCCTNVWG